MLIGTVCSIAVYCQRCGKIHIYDIPYFFGTKRLALHCESCGYERAVLLRCAGNKLELSVECVVCGTVTHKLFEIKNLRRLKFEKLFCSNDNFELGYIGRRRKIEEMLAFNQAEFEALHPEDGKNFIEKQHILLEAVNRVHDMAAAGAVGCPCGSKEIAADIRGNSIILECCHCGRYYVLKVEDSGDLIELEKGQAIDLIAPEIRGEK